jgi:hypothetical protein
MIASPYVEVDDRSSRLNMPLFYYKNILPDISPVFAERIVRRTESVQTLEGEVPSYHLVW